MKFIHTADLYLDSPLRGLSAYADAPAERLRSAVGDTIDRLSEGSFMSPHSKNGIRYGPWSIGFAVNTLGRSALGFKQ